MAGPVEVRAVASRSDLDRFIKLPWRIYQNDPLWVAPLLMDVRKVLNRDIHPFHKHAEVEYFMAERDGELVGRIAAIVNHAHNEFHNDRVGFFGFFESIDDQSVADALLRRSETWLRERGRDRARGPTNFSTNDELLSPGLLIDGFDKPPAIMMAHTPPYYVGLLERSGYAKAMDLLAFWMDARQTPERFARAMKKLARSSDVVLRPLNLRDFDGEVARLKTIYNASWERNWGFVPMTDDEFTFLAKQLKPIVEPHLISIGEAKGEPVAFGLVLPDFNQALKHVNGRLFPFGLLKFLWHKRKIDRVRMLTLGVTPAYRKQGIDVLMLVGLMEESQKRGIAQGEGSWVLEDNVPMIHGMERMGAFVYKTYRVYEKPL